MCQSLGGATDIEMPIISGRWRHMRTANVLAFYRAFGFSAVTRLTKQYNSK